MTLCRWTLPCRTAALALGALTVLACEPPEEDPAIPTECLDDVLVDDGGGGESPKRRGQLNLLERHYADGSPITTVVGAKFADFTLHTGTSQEGTVLSGTCIGLTGQPVRSDRHCEYTTTPCEENDTCETDVSCVESDRLAVGGVRLEGLADGPVDLDPQGVGTFIKAGLSRLFGSGTVDVQLTAASGENLFVNNDGSLLGIPSPRVVEVTEPALDGSGVLERIDTLLRWTPGDPSDVVFIDLVARHSFITDPSVERNVIVSCVALDDGCQAIWAGAIEWLVRPEPDWQMGEKVTVIVSRRNQLAVDLSGDIPDTELTAALSAELHGELRLQP